MKHLKIQPGFMFFDGEEIAYIGQTENLAERIGDQINNSDSNLRRNIIKVEEFNILYNKDDVEKKLSELKVSGVCCNASREDREEIEKGWIERENPKYNDQHNREFNQ